jgi:hypothetical protein
MFAAGGLAAGVGAGWTDRPGQVLLIPLAALLLAQAARGWFAGPAVVADRTALTLRPTWRPVQVTWTEVGAVGARSGRRALGTEWLEVEIGDQLVTLPEWRLGRPAAEVAQEIEARRPRGGG